MGSRGYALFWKTILWCITSSLGSYLETPRINFAGHYRADAETINNMPCNFDMDLSYDPNTNKNWNGMGTNEFSFQNTKVYGAVDGDGNVVNETDAVIGASVLDNGKAPFAKMVIQDVDTENTTAIYGLRFGVGWKQEEPGHQNYAFYGNWTPNIISQLTWHKVKCYNDSIQQDTYPRGVQATTTLTNVVWKKGTFNSKVLEDLRARSIENNNTLQVSVIFYFYTRNVEEFVNVNFTLGYMVGTIGVYQYDEPLNYGGNRLLVPFEGGPAPSNLKFDANDSCYGLDTNLFKPWMFKAPFIVNNYTKSLTIDLSNSLPIHNTSLPRNIGRLYIVVLHKDNRFESLGEVNYFEENWLWKTGGVVDFKLNEPAMEYILANANVAAVIQDPEGIFKDIGDYILYGNEASDNYTVMLSETQYYIRPQGFYNARLEKNDTFDLSIYVSTLGKPAKGVTTIVKPYIKIDMPPLPMNGVMVSGTEQTNYGDTPYATSVTDDKGFANFTFKVYKDMSPNRTYLVSPCSEGQKPAKVLPINGQSYQFKYSVCDEDCSPADEDISHEDITPISVRAFASSPKKSDYTWEENIYPIFYQYYHLYPVMNSILNLSDFRSVSKYTNLQMLLYSMTRDFNDPNYMPATRDLPPSTQEMVVEWLKKMLEYYLFPFKIRMNTSDNPFNTPELVELLNCVPIKRNVAVSKFDIYSSADVCKYKAIPIDGNMSLYIDDYYIETLNKSPIEKECTRPLYGYSNTSTDQSICNVPNVQAQLQLAIQLEFSTLPIYLTTLYSLEKDCNEEIYNMTRSVAMQEMLHFIQAANILVATGKDPIIDSAEFVPSYPGIGLPGCCHPKLEVKLSKFSMELMHNLFVTIEQPHFTFVAREYPEVANHTIGQFYNEITQCIETLDSKGVKIFLNDSKQVSWPWTILPGSPLGQVHLVRDVDSALAGIKEIVDQGEGTTPFDPHVDEKGYELAHYYRFQEIVCKKHLQSNGTHYAYDGRPISYNPDGIYNMRLNPRSKTVRPDTNCYTEAKAFHSVFRAMLRELQVTFSGNPNNMFKAVELMESLQIHLKRVMRVIYSADDDDINYVDQTTCGPVWDYTWTEASK